MTGPIHFFPTFTFRFQIGKGLIPENSKEVDKTELRLNKVDKSEMREGGREVEEEGRVFGGCLVGIYGPS